MPSPQSQRLTSGYRGHLEHLRATAEIRTRQAWAGIDTENLQGTFPQWLTAVAPFVETVQGTASGLTVTYLGTYVGSELGEPYDLAFDPAPFVGVDTFDRPLTRALGTPILSVLKAIKEGQPLADAMKLGLDRAVSLAGEAVVESARRTQFAAMEADPAIEGWHRVPRGTCGACLADTSEESRPLGVPLHRHPGCLCVGEGDVAGVPDRFPRPSGQQLFERMSDAERVAQFGPEKAALLSTGDLALSDLAHEHELVLGGTILTEATLEQATR